MATQKFTILGIKYDFNKAFFRTTSTCFTTCTKWELTNFDIVSCFFSFSLSISYRCNFWPRVGASRNIAIIQRSYMLTTKFFNTDNSLCTGNVSKSRTMNYISNGIYPWNICLVIIINHYLTIFCFNS